MGFRIDVAHMVIKDRELRDNPPVGDDDRSWMEKIRGQRQEFNSLRPEVHDVHRRWREVADSYDPPRLLVGETFGRALDDLFPFSDGDQLHLDFNIPFAHAPFERRAAARMIGARRRRCAMTAGVDGEQPRHLAVPDAVGRGDPAACAAMLLLRLRGTVFLYEGDEIGMTDVDVPRASSSTRWASASTRTPGGTRCGRRCSGRAEPGGGFTDRRGHAVAPVR